MVSKNGKKVFTINTYYGRGELETIQEVIKLNNWSEAFHATNEGHLMWFGLALRDNDVAILKKRPKVWFNRYPGSEYLARKKVTSQILNRM